MRAINWADWRNWMTPNFGGVSHGAGSGRCGGQLGNNPDGRESMNPW